MKKQKIKAFTLVELIIVITILAILATIGFMSFQSYTLDARDTNRVTNLKEISKWLDIYQTKNWILPNPDIQTVTTKDASWNIITIQWYAGLDVLKIIKMTNNPKDPQNTEYYTYTINWSRTKYQLLALLEKNWLAYKNSKILNQTYAWIIDYSTKYRYTLGNKVWIFFTWVTNEPLQVNSSWSFDLSTKSEKIRVMFSNDNSNSWTIEAIWSSLPDIIEEETKSIAINSSQNNISWDSIYTILDCPSVNIARKWTTVSKSTILSNINNYIWCTVTWYTWLIAWYTYSWSITPENKMVIIVDTNNLASAEWWLYWTDLATMESINRRTNTITMTWNIVAWDWLNNTQKILVWLTRVWQTWKAAQLCNRKWLSRYLPATEELNQLYCYNNNDATNDWARYWAWIDHADCINKWYLSQNKSLLPNFLADIYWSSTEYDLNRARWQNFSSWYRNYYYFDYYKNYSVGVRCITRF